jgi:hypothetical protein
MKSAGHMSIIPWEGGKKIAKYSRPPSEWN